MLQKKVRRGSRGGFGGRRAFGWKDGKTIFWRQLGWAGLTEDCRDFTRPKDGGFEEIKKSIGMR